LKPYYQHGDIRIYCGDAREVAPQLEPVDLVVTSPPYAEQRRYGFKTGAFRWDHVVPRVLAGVNLAPDGQMLVNLGLVHRDGEVVCYWEPMIHTLRSFGYRLFGWYVWDQGAGLPGDWHGRLAPSHEWIFHFNRSPAQPTKWVPCVDSGDWRPTSKSRTRADGSANITYNHAGGHKIGSHKIADSVFRIHRNAGKRDGQPEHPAVFPTALAESVIRSFGGVVLDPFMGSGTSLIVAGRLNRAAIGIEVNERYCEMAANRLDAESAQLELEQPA
jgi:DNA modification methylase